MKNRCKTVICVPSCGKCTCPPGPTGATGAIGPPGPTGATGATGATGGVKNSPFYAVGRNQLEVDQGDCITFEINPVIDNTVYTMINNDKVRILQPGNYLVQYIVQFGTNIEVGTSGELDLSLQNVDTATEIENTAYSGISFSNKLNSDESEVGEVNGRAIICVDQPPTTICLVVKFISGDTGISELDTINRSLSIVRLNDECVS